MRCLLALLVLATAGCTDDLGGKQKVTGTITWNGEPIEDGTITLISAEGDADAGRISGGRFELFAKPGDKTVSVLAYKVVGERKDERGIPNPVKHQYMPDNFNKKSELKETIGSREGPVTLALTGTEVPSAEAFGQMDPRAPERRQIRR